MYLWLNKLFYKLFQKKKIDLEDFTDKFYQTFKKEIVLIFVSLQVEKEGLFSNSIYKAGITQTEK